MRETPKTFSPSRLKEARKNLSDEDVASAAKVTATTVRNWQAGKGEPDATPLAAIAALTGKPLDFFFERA